MRCFGNGLLDLQVGLPIQVCRFNVAKTFRFGRRQHHQVSWEWLFGLDTNNVTN